MIRSINPATDEVIATYEAHSPTFVERAIARAQEAQASWVYTSLDTRATHLQRLANTLTERRDALAELMAREMGKPIREGVAEIDKCAWVCRYYADNGATMLADLPISTERTKSYVAYRPLGVVLAVMPWNFPFWQVFRFLAPALMAGNAGVLKHASNVTGCALAIDDMVAASGFPAGLFRTLILPSTRVAEVLTNPGVAAATLTGSDVAGRAVASRAGASLKKTVLELGGSDPYLVLADADLDIAVTACSAGRLLNAGQSCIAAKRFIVHTSIVGEFTTRLAERMAEAVMGDPLDPGVTLGPLARADLRDDLHDQVRRSLSAGARLVIGGTVPPGPGAFYPPTVLADVAAGMPVYSEETFGPVASVMSFDDESDAIRIANDSDFGLGAAVFTRDVVRGEQIARERLEAGACFVNSFVASDPRLPFGGIKMSGYGRELAANGMHEFLNIKTVVVD
ncbi:MAG: NAD-dependent succinate-semialdehyde dehydrogenase [Actinobacteria bacterium]|nr:NAD-dependent succinate-semialdehyde dehydrogenase [Actinomycetota bacterium]